MKAYFECRAGISGDMILAALVDVGLEFDFLYEELKKLNITFELKKQKITVDGISATKVDVIDKEKEKIRRGLYDIYKIIDDSGLDGKIKNKAKKIFYNLAAAESKVHGVAIDKVHFHELGAVDTIVDICGAVVGIEKLGLTEIYCSVLSTGTGFVNTEHGKLEIPAPATKELLSGLPTSKTDIEAELATPTGAVIITTVAKEFGDKKIKAAKTGYGAGTMKLKIPNVLKIILF